MVMNGYAVEFRQNICILHGMDTTFLMNRIISPVRGTGGMQPLGMFFHLYAGFVEMSYF